MMKGTEVFGALANDYARYRPGYPAEVVDELVRECGLTPGRVIADIGSGTGNLARVFLAAGYQVIGVEPNREMREEGERLLASYPAFRSLDGTAERVPLDRGSVDMVTVGQARPRTIIGVSTTAGRAALRGTRRIVDRPFRTSSAQRGGGVPLHHAALFRTVGRLALAIPQSTEL